MTLTYASQWAKAETLSLLCVCVSEGLLRQSIIFNEIALHCHQLANLGKHLAPVCLPQRTLVWMNGVSYFHHDLLTTRLSPLPPLRKP